MMRNHRAHTEKFLSLRYFDGECARASRGRGRPYGPDDGQLFYNPDKRVPEKGPLFFGKPLCGSNAINARC